MGRSKTLLLFLNVIEEDSIMPYFIEGAKPTEINSLDRTAKPNNKRRDYQRLPEEGSVTEAEKGETYDSELRGS